MNNRAAIKRAIKYTTEFSDVSPGNIVNDVASIAGVSLEELCMFFIRERKALSELVTERLLNSLENCAEDKFICSSGEDEALLKLHEHLMNL